MPFLSKSFTSFRRFSRPGVHSQIPGLRRAIQTTPKEFKVTLDGGTLYVEQEIAEALGWRAELPVEGVSLRLSGWAPKYFAITKKDTDVDRLAVSTIEGSRDPQVQAVLERLKQKDSE